jgi:hypothetical protein
MHFLTPISYCLLFVYIILLAAFQFNSVLLSLLAS